MSRSFEDIADSQREVIRAQEVRVSDLQDEVSELHGQLSDLEGTRGLAADLKESLRKQQDERAQVEAYYKATIDRLREDLAKSTTSEANTSTPQDGRPCMSSIGRDFNRASMGQDDLLAITQVMQRSNVDLVKNVLDESRRQQERFYTNMQTPKVELRVFDGEITKFRAFMNRFDDVIGNTDCPYSVKLNTLLQYCDPKVLQHLSSCEYQNSQEGYLTARKILRDKYGRPHMIIQAWLEKIMTHKQPKTGEQLQIFASDLRLCKMTLQELGSIGELDNTDKKRMIVAKLPLYIQNRWRKVVREAETKGHIGTLKMLLDLIDEAADEQSHPVYGPDSLAKVANQWDHGVKPNQGVKKKMMTTTGVEESSATGAVSEVKKKDAPSDKKSAVKEPCECCGGRHYTRTCDKFKAMSSQEKLLFVRKQKMCLLCLSPKHAVEECLFTWRCQKTPCAEKHNNVLHEALEAEAGKAASGSNPVRGVSMKLSIEKPNLSRNSGVAGRVRQPMLTGTSDITEYALPVSAVTVGGLKETCGTYAMHDSGGGFTVITKRLKERAGILPIKTAYFKMTTLAGEECLNVEMVTFPIKEKGSDRVHLVFNAVVLDREIVDPRYAAILKQLDPYSHLDELNVPTHESDEVDILIGQDNAHLMSKEGEEVHGRHSYGPYAVKTPIGWTIQGFGMDGTSLAQFPSFRLTRTSVMTSTIDRLAEERLQLAVEKMMTLEEVPDVKIMSPVNTEITTMWEKSTRMVDGHVEVKIPVKSEMLNLPDGRDGVVKRMQSLGRRLKKDPDLHKKFKAAMEENFKQGYAERAVDDAEVGEEWFVPLQPVTSDRKPGVCRIVGDLSYTSKGACLNTAVNQGPNLTSHVVDNLLKFRRYEVALTGDIKSMYNRVKVPVEQRKYLKFLYWKNGDVDDELETYQMTTHMFGATWAPSACIYALRWLAMRWAEDYSAEVIDMILHHFYVDDLLSSVINRDLGKKVIHDAIELLGRGGFELLKIGSNDVDIMNSIPVESRAKNFEVVTLGSDGEVREMTLGGVWMPQRDVMTFKAIQKTAIYTRRGILSVMSSLFDPLGLLSPFVLIAHILLQEICKLNYGWDEEISSELRERWDDWLAGLEIVTGFEIPRWLGFTKTPGVTYQLQTFVDASERGYGCVTYLSIKNEFGQIMEVNLIAAKSKVTPVKVVTIPRLELCSAVLGIKMTKVVTEFLEVELEPANYWSDSTIVLYYINGKPWQYRTFVANRVVFIQENSSTTQWRHVPGRDNVADVTSRGLLGTEMIDHTEWKTGPAFLKDVNLWPSSFNHKEDDVDLEKVEMKKLSHQKFQLVHLTNEDSENMCKKFLEYFSRWNRLLRAVCVWRRWAAWLKHKKIVKGTFTVDELYDAENAVVKLTQQIYLSSGQRSSRMFDKLFLFTADGILRVGGRLMMAKLAYEEKHPPIFPRCSTQESYIFHIHERQGHSGVDRTYYEARRKYWLLGGRVAVKKALHGCVTCTKIRGRFHEQIMAPLPSFRVEEGKTPFEKIGVDYFGPFYCKHGRGQIKRYACMFTDLVMRASHVEIVPDMTSSSFINALQRFISVRGKPVLIVSDNGTNFVGAKREMKEAVAEWNVANTAKYMAEENIRWIFNTPAASHHGGVWERLIRSFRTLAMAVMKDEVLTEDSLRTFACIITQIMNSRPLTKMTEDPQDPLPLTPEHLLTLKQAGGIVGDYSKGDTLRERWRHLQHLGDKFWKRWSQEYLRQLQARPKWHTTQKDVKVGDVVLIADMSLPQLHWPLGLITEVTKGRDNHVRSVKMKTEKGEMSRPTSKIINLECS